MQRYKAQKDSAGIMMVTRDDQGEFVLADTAYAEMSRMWDEAYLHGVNQAKALAAPAPAPAPAEPGVNPKDAVATAKPDLSLVTGPMLVGLAAALANGAKKYGRKNWRETPVLAMVYTAAALRHIKAWEDGEDFALDSGVHHLDHALASLAIIRDAAAAGTLEDNRGPALPAATEETKS